MKNKINVTTLDEKIINNVRLLANKMITKAGSGHPGIALGAAPALFELYANQMILNPKNPNFENRDRFVLSAGHGSALLYSMLHAAGFAITGEDLAAFRQFGSITPGHPEVNVTPGIEATTGPLGQGLGMAVGMAMAEAKLHHQFPNVIDHYTYVLVGDGDLMEGISHEVASLAGQQQLKKLIVLHDDNDITLDGEKSRSDITDMPKRFESYGWDVRKVADGNDLIAIHDAIENAKLSPEPSFISIKTIIGESGPFAGTSKAHGTPLTEKQLNTLADNLDVTLSGFEIDTDLRQNIQERIAQRLALQKQPTKDEKLAYQAFVQHHDISDVHLDALQTLQAGRKIGHAVLQKMSQAVPNIWGGSADLIASTNANIEESGVFSSDDLAGRNIAFGVREFAMSTVMNGIALHGGTKVFGATFLAFSDYMKAGIRLSALQKQPVIYIFTHDSITVGEDGPTHQPIEQLMGLRMIPGVDVLRPGSAQEIAAAWRQALRSTQRPTILILSRGTIGNETTAEQAENIIQHGAGIVETDDQPVVNLIATGTEVQLAMQVKQQLADQHITSRVVSMPNLNRYLELDEKDQAAIIDEQAKKDVVIEAGNTLGWQSVVGKDGLIFGIDQFGASAQPNAMMVDFGLTATHISQRIMESLQ